jgi:hypothetical protein
MVMKRQHPKNWKLIFIGASILLISLLLAGLITAAWFKWQQRQASGMADGIIVQYIPNNEYRFMGIDTKVHYFVKYEFAVSDEIYKDSQGVSSEVYYELKQSDNVKILYDKSNPENTAIANHDPSPMWFSLASWIGVFLGIVLLVKGFFKKNTLSLDSHPVAQKI